jgi:hypothetical protein
MPRGFAGYRTARGELWTWLGTAMRERVGTLRPLEREAQGKAAYWNSFCTSVLKAEVNEGLSDMAFVLVCVLLPVFVGFLTLRTQ